MPNLIGYSEDAAVTAINALNTNLIPTISYETVTYPVNTDIVLAQTPAAGQTIQGVITLTISGSIKLPNVGVTVFTQPAVLIGNDDNP